MPNEQHIATKSPAAVSAGSGNAAGPRDVDCRAITIHFISSIFKALHAQNDKAVLLPFIQLPDCFDLKSAGKYARHCRHLFRLILAILPPVEARDISLIFMKGVHTLNILQLRYFEVIAYYQNLSKAAQELMVSQPALSNVLSQLETDLGAPLFDRKGKKLMLNTTGEMFLNTTKNILHLLDDSLENLKNQQKIAGQLRVCCHINCAEFFTDVGEFARLYPDVQFHFFSADKLKGEPRLSAFDLVVLPDYECDSLPHVILGERHTLYAVLPRNHRLANKAAIELIELKDDYFYFVSPRDGRLEHAYNRCIEAGFTPKIRYVPDNNSAYQPLLLTGTAVTLTYNTNPLYFQHWDDLITVPIADGYQAGRKVSLCLPSDSPTPLARTFWSFVCGRHQQFSSPDLY